VRNDVTVAQGDSFVSDGAKRDRLDWGGDNVVSNPVAYLTTGESTPARNSLEWFASHPSPAGQVPGVYLPPPNGFNYGWGEYAAWWVNNYWTHYLYTGDRAFLDRWFQTMQNNISWFESNVGDDGLWDVPGGAGGHWGYGDSGKETYDNAVYVWALRAAARVAAAEGRDDLAATYDGFADRTSKAVNDLLWDAGAGAYRLKPGAAAHPLDANAMAVAAGIARGDRADAALSFIEKNLATPHGDLAVDGASGSPVPRYISPFVAYQELLAYSASGSTEGNREAMDVLRRTWEHMLTGDTTKTFWETVSPTGGLGLGSYTSLSHGWAAGPTLYLTNEVLGVRPTAGGFDRFEVLPHPDGSLPWAEGSVPTPHGDITAAWRRGQDGGLAVQVAAPGGTSYVTGVPAENLRSLRVNGAEVWKDGHALSPDVKLEDGYVRVSGRSGDTHLDASYDN
jgi:hypothetical protein